MGRRHVGCKGYLALLAGGQSDGNNVVATQRGNGLAFILHTVYRIAYHTPGIV